MSHKKYRTETNCLNCGAEVTGKFCSNCGQENLETRENFFHIAFHFISDYFHFDSKFFRSLIPLFTKPGYLTKEYWQGRRVHYIHPLRLFFFITILFMISETAFYHRFGEEFKTKIRSEKISDDEGELAKLNPEQREERIKELRVGNERRMNKILAGIDNFFGYFKYMTFFLLPVYAIVFKVLYRRNRAFYVDHLVYTIHVQSFVYCLFGVAFLLPFIFPAVLEYLFPVLLLMLFVYLVISLKFLYQQVWWKTILKSVLATGSLFFITVFAMIIYAFVDAIFFM
ncbi:MAG TPA: DUF3667 domain-containing protein [Cyclobacteriaceae bacterium]|nr:DUF3667 domain-containing protein [Cyclobacteriaceae bacterium]